MIQKLRDETKGSDFLNESEKARVRKTREQLRKGEDIFADLKVVVPDQKRERVLREPTLEEIQAREQRWKDGVEGTPSKGSRRWKRGIEGEYPEAPDFVDPLVEVVDKTILTCSFCGSPVSRVRATIGTGKPQLKFDLQVVSLIPLEVIEKVKVSSKRLVACPDHSLFIEPAKDDEGNIKHSNIRPYSEG